MLGGSAFLLRIGGRLNLQRGDTMRIDVTSNIKEFEKDLLWHEKKSMRFVSALALTRTAQVVQKAIIRRVPRIFNVTKKWWLKQQPTGIKIKPAKKGAALLFSEVYTKAHWAIRQEDGGLKTPYSSPFILIPSKIVPKYGRRAGGARKVIAGKKVLHHNGDPKIQCRGGRSFVLRRKTKKRHPLEILYTVENDQVTIIGRWRFKLTAKAQAMRHFPRELKKAYDYAMKHRR